MSVTGGDSSHKVSRHVSAGAEVSALVMARRSTLDCALVRKI
jgi:hypothetical protein